MKDLHLSTNWPLFWLFLVVYNNEMLFIIWISMLLFGYVVLQFSMISILCFIVILISIITIASKLQQYFQAVYLALRLPGPPAYPLLGNSLKVFDNDYLFHMAKNGRTEYGPIIRCWVTVYPVIFILEPRHIQKILLSSKLVKKSAFYGWMHNFLGRGLVTTEEQNWRKHRKLIQPAFRTSTLDEYSTAIFKGVQSFLASIADIINYGNDINVTSHVNDAVFKILQEIVFGAPNELGYNVDCFRRGKVRLQDRISMPWLISDSLYKISQWGQEDLRQMKELTLCCERTIAERKLMNQRSIEGNKCLLDHFLAIGFTEEECISEITTFMLAGQDTVSGAFSFALYCLASNQDVQEKVYAEITEIVENHAEGIKINELNKLQYMEQCINEVLRLYPSIAVFGRRLSEDVDLDGTILPVGTEVAFSPFATHRLSSQFSDPEEFNPERFSPTNVLKRDPCAFIPFSAGPRNCIGNKLAMLELKTLLAFTLLKYRLSLPKGKERVELKYRVTLRASGGIWIHFADR